VLAETAQVPYDLHHMRVAIATVFAFGVALGVAPAVVHADSAPLPGVVFENRVIPMPEGASPLAPISHTLFLNRCTGGCLVTPTSFMTDDSRTDRSSIPSTAKTLSQGYGPTISNADAQWATLVDCVKQTFLPFNIDVVTTDPGTASHHEVMITDSASTTLRSGLNAGGVAPFIGCGGTYNNGLSFVFQAGGNSMNFICGAVAQEAAHVWGLDHEYQKDDPMTYLNLGSLKRFQNVSVQCHDSSQPPNPVAQCQCGDPMQNSYQYMLQTFGASNLPPATLTISTPQEAQWVKPGFPIRASLTSVISGAEGGNASIDGTPSGAVTGLQPLAFNAPTTLAGGDHAVTVNGVDGGGRSASATVHVKVTAACSATMKCGNGLNCIGGYCIPGRDVDGGLGTQCSSNDNCITGQCGSADGDQLCTGACNSDGTCPDGYSCLGGAGADGVCWPSASNSGCSTSGAGSSSGGPLAMLAGLGFAAIVLRRRAHK